MKKALTALLSAALMLGLFAACGAQNGGAETSKAPAAQTSAPAGTSAPAATTAPKTEAPKAEAKSIQVAAIETAYGKTGWENVAKAFTAKTGIAVDLIIDKDLEAVINPAMQAGDYPDVVARALGTKLGLVERMIKSNALADLSDVPEMTIPGETKKVKDAILDGFLDSSMLRPYADKNLYLMPTFYSPCGLFYNANLFKTKGWELPKTFDELFALGEKAKADGISLFAYPTAGYFDGFFYSLLHEAGGVDFFNKVTHYTEGIWDTPEAKLVADTVYKLAQATDKSVPSNANNEGFKNNQSLILNDKALFMPNGTWVVDEMKDAPRVDGFQWGFMPLPALKAGGERYSYTFYEQVWVPKEAKNIDGAKQFLAFLYSDEATKLFLNNGQSPAVQPVKGVDKLLTGDNQLFYSIYNDGVKPAMGVWAATTPVEGVNISDTVFSQIDSLVTGDLSEENWVGDIKAASDKLRPALQQ